MEDSLVRALKSVLLSALAMVLFLPPAHAIDVDWFGSITLSDGDRTYLNISAAHFGSDRNETVAVARRLSDPERDLPVLLFLAAESGRSLQFILDLRLGGLSWWEVRARLGIPPDRVIVVLPRDPGPPYGKAHGYYRKHPRGQQAEVILTDAEFADWVGIRVLSQAYGMEPIAVIEARQSGRQLGQVVLEEEKKKAGKGGTRGADKKSSAKNDSAPGNSGSKGKGKGKK
jgi:hypothetical protein